MKTTKDDTLDAMNEKKPEGLNELNNPYRVMVVDDSMTMRKIVIQQLKSEAYEICGEAADGQEAVEKYKELAPDVITLDVNMPVMDGILALRSILEYDRSAKVVMLTSEGQKQMIVKAIGEGASGYITKPPQKEMVCREIRAALAK